MSIKLYIYLVFCIILRNSSQRYPLQSFLNEISGAVICAGVVPIYSLFTINLERVTLFLRVSTVI